MTNHEVVEFYKKEDLLEKTDDVEVLMGYTASLNNPAIKDSSTLAECVRNYAGYGEIPDKDDLREARRSRIRQINMDTAVLSNTKYDNLVDETHQEYDEGFAAIVQALIFTRDSRDLDSQRKALMLLCDLRVAALRVGAYDAEPWIKIAHRLIM